MFWSLECYATEDGWLVVNYEGSVTWAGSPDVIQEEFVFSVIVVSPAGFFPDRGQNTKVPEWVFCAPREVCNQEEDLSDEREEPSADPGAKGCIKRIRAITGQYVDRVEFQLRSGIHQVYGESTGGCSSECFAVEKDEAVVEVTQIPTRKYLAQMLEFKTSKGRIFSTKGYGGPGKEPQRIVFAAPEGRQICGLVFEGVKLSAVCHQKCSKTGSRKHPQKLVENFMAGFNAYQ